MSFTITEEEKAAYRALWKSEGKPVTQAKEDPMPITVEYLLKQRERENELILEMKAEISTLKSQLNNCRQKRKGD